MIDFETDILKCLEVLRAGGIILYPTDTVWGLGCDATNELAVQKIFALKQRPGNKSLVVLVADERDILKYVTQPDLEVFSYLKSVSKPTTVIYSGAAALAQSTISQDGSVAMRITREPFTKNLIKRFRKPLVSTSANLSGAPSPGKFADISPVIKTGADYVVNYRQDDDSDARPSSIVKWNGNGKVIILRP
jgi:L-threonylcarbamoyladenylate synthase